MLLLLQCLLRQAYNGKDHRLKSLSPDDDLGSRALVKHIFPLHVET